MNKVCCYCCYWDVGYSYYYVLVVDHFDFVYRYWGYSNFVMVAVVEHFDYYYFYNYGMFVALVCVWTLTQKYTKERKTLLTALKTSRISLFINSYGYSINTLFIITYHLRQISAAIVVEFIGLDFIISDQCLYIQPVINFVVHHFPNFQIIIGKYFRFQLN